MLETEKSYKSLGKKESELITKLKKYNLKVFSINDIVSLLQISKSNIEVILSRLTKKKWIDRVSRGVYEISDSEQESISYLAAKAYWPSYASLWTALNFHHLTEQIPSTTFMITTKKTMTKNIAGVKVKYIHTSPYRFFGYTQIENIVIADKEKSIIDSLLFPRYVPISEITNTLKSKEIDYPKLIKYALQCKSLALNKRLGLLLEKCKANKKLLKPLLANNGKGFSLLDPTKKNNKQYNKKWLVIENVKI